MSDVIPSSVKLTESVFAHDTRGRRFIQIRRRDAEATPVLRAAGYLGPSGYRTYAAPHRFVDVDGVRYLVKRRAQEGLGAELIAGRIGSYLGIAPEAVAIEIGPAALPRDGSLSPLVGRQLATVELDNVFNNDELEAYGLDLRADQIDWDSWALVVCFQSWLYVRDAQAVLRTTDGKVFSIDHGNCFFELIKGPPTGFVVPALRGLSGISFDASAVDRAIKQIEQIPEVALLTMVSNVPESPGWRMPLERRLRTAEWLLKRQPRLREVMDPWMPRVS